MFVEFDPLRLGRKESAPPLLHLQFGDGSKVSRYVLVEEIPAHEMNPQLGLSRAEHARFGTKPIAEVHKKIREEKLLIAPAEQRAEVERPLPPTAAKPEAPAVSAEPKKKKKGK